MKFVTFAEDGEPRLGVYTKDGDAVVALTGAAADLPGDLLSVIAGGPGALERIAMAVTEEADPREPGDLKLLAPIPVPPRNILCVGRNYHEHAEEFHASGFDATAGKTAVPDDPIIFTKAPSSVIATGERIPIHLDPTNTTDYEGELAVVIGTGGQRIAAADAYDHVFGYTIVNDVTARELQNRHKQWFIGKSVDGYCPMGPSLVTAGDIPDVSVLRLVTEVNGEVRQDASVADLIFDIPTLIETISAYVTLQPGDIIATGTPVGVGIGFDPPIFLKSGDRVSVTVEPIGTLENVAA